MLDFIIFFIGGIYMVWIFQWVELCSDMLPDMQAISSVLYDYFLSPWLFRTTKFYGLLEDLSFGFGLGKTKDRLFEQILLLLFVSFLCSEW